MHMLFRTAAACTLLLGAAPALAQGALGGADHARTVAAMSPPYAPGPDRRPVWKEDRAPAYAMDPQARASWLADCRYRVAQRGFGNGADHCAVWLDSQGARYVGYGYGETVMVPVSRPGDCVETVVREAPTIRRTIPRRAPVRRDKRIPLR